MWLSSSGLAREEFGKGEMCLQGLFGTWTPEGTYTAWWSKQARMRLAEVNRGRESLDSEKIRVERPGDC